MNEDFILRSVNGYYIVDSDLPSEGSIEMPDSTKDIGCSVGKVIQVPLKLSAHKIVPSWELGQTIFYDGSRAFKIHTSEGDFIAVKEPDIIAYLK